MENEKIASVELNPRTILKYMATIFLISGLLSLFFGCGTLRYQVIATKGEKGRTQIQWDVVTLNFNSFWKGEWIK